LSSSSTLFLAGQQVSLPKSLDPHLLRFYPIFVLGIQFFLIMMGMEYGPMLHCERKARRRHASSKKADHEPEGGGLEAPSLH
jgi:Na+/H+ antiporter NhaC